MERAMARQLARTLHELKSVLESNQVISITVDKFDEDVPRVHLAGMKSVLNLGQQPVQVRKMADNPNMEGAAWFEVSVMLGGVCWHSCGTMDDLIEVGLAEPKTEGRFAHLPPGV